MKPPKTASLAAERCIHYSPSTRDAALTGPHAIGFTEAREIEWRGQRAQSRLTDELLARFQSGELS